MHMSCIPLESCLSACLPACLPACLSVCLSLSVSLSLFLSPSHLERLLNEIVGELDEDRLLRLVLDGEDEVLGALVVGEVVQAAHTERGVQL